MLVPGRKEPVSVSKKDCFVRILGDDLLAVWPRDCDEKYTQSLSDVGLPISSSKHQSNTHYANFARLWFEPIFMDRRHVTNEDDLWMSPEAADKGVGRRVYDDGGMRVVKGFRWVETVTVGAFGRASNGLR
jgi:hypothetical protein